MMAIDRDKNILNHMIGYCEEIEDTVARFGNAYEIFADDSAYRNACALCILQIGELSGHLSEQFRKENAHIPWQQIRGMRNIVAHAYGSVDKKSIWQTMIEDIPALKEFCLSK